MGELFYFSTFGVIGAGGVGGMDGDEFSMGLDLRGLLNA